MARARYRVLALDLEGTLISNAMSQIARPGLCTFLDYCSTAFPRVVIYTFVAEQRFRQIARALVDEGSAPNWFASIEYVSWDREVKDLRFVPRAPPARTLLVDDYEPYVHRDQWRQWVPIRPFDPEVDGDDELHRVQTVLDAMQSGSTEACRQQAAAIPYRRSADGHEVLLVTSISSGSWILPKGLVFCFVLP